MADVLIVCVRDDEPQAKSLADMFERAGFSVGGAPSNDGALRSSGAAVVVWSQASIRSRPFLDAAQRVVNADKAVLACLIEPPPADSVKDAPSFDLSGWSGDPDDPSLDPLFFAVDRMVNSARAAVGAGQAQPAPTAFDPPPSLRPPPNAPPYARAARTAPPEARTPPPAPLPPGFQMRDRAAPAPAPQRAPIQPPAAPQNDPLGSEASHWRAIRNSNDPTDFLDYLTRHGPTSAFAELAELRLKQLEAAPGQAGGRTRTPAPSNPFASPPPRRAEAPLPPPAPQRRIEPPPAPVARRAPEPERSYERAPPPPIDRPPPAPRSGGGALRTFILLLLLAGGALAAGIYYGMGDEAMKLLAPAAEQSENYEDVDALAPVGEPADADAPVEPFEPAILDEGPPAPRAEPQRAAPQNQAQERQNERAREREAARAEPTPPPTSSWGQEPSSSGAPASLAPPSNAGASAPQDGFDPYAATGGPVALHPAAPAPQTQVAANTQQPAAAPRGSIQWTRRPSAQSIADRYPRQALRDGRGGSVTLNCTVRADLAVSCAVASESPPGAGFGRAALEAARDYRARATLSNGASAVGAQTRVQIAFRAPED